MKSMSEHETPFLTTVCGSLLGNEQIAADRWRSFYGAGSFHLCAFGEEQYSRLW
jgi:hypothetical protein